MPDAPESPSRDWDKELAKVDALMAKDAGAPAPAPASPARPSAIPDAGGRKLKAHEWLGTWTRVILGLLIGFGITQWPYTYGCGLKLFFYLIAVAAVIAAGVWSSISSWRRHLGLAHVLSQLLIVWGLVLGARELLPRVGYAKHAAVWFCPDVPPK